jgi:hypothetical protein
MVIAMYWARKERRADKMHGCRSLRPHWVVNEFAQPLQVAVALIRMQQTDKGLDRNGLLAADDLPEPQVGKVMNVGRLSAPAIHKAIHHFLVCQLPEAAHGQFNDTASKIIMRQQAALRAVEATLCAV